MRREVFFTILLYSSTNIFGMSTESVGKLYHRPKVKSSAPMVEKPGAPIPSSSNSKLNFNSRKRKTIEVIEIDDDEPNKKVCVSRDIFTYIGENLPVEPKDRYEIYSQYHYELVKNHMMGFSTPTTVLVYPKGNPRI